MVESKVHLGVCRNFMSIKSRTLHLPIRAVDGHIMKLKKRHAIGLTAVASKWLNQKRVKHGVPMAAIVLNHDCPNEACFSDL